MLWQINVHLIVNLQDWYVVYIWVPSSLKTEVPISWRPAWTTPWGQKHLRLEQVPLQKINKKYQQQKSYTKVIVDLQPQLIPTFSFMI